MLATRRIDTLPAISQNGAPTMDIIFAVLADAANVSQEGKLNIMGNFAHINAAKFPARHPQMQLVIRMEASPAEVDTEKKLEVQILDADGAKIAGFGGELKIPKPKKSGERVQMQLVIGLVDTVFPKEGRYGVYILVDGNEKATIPLTVGVEGGEDHADANDD